MVLSRIRIGHTKLTHSFIFTREDQPECIACQALYTVRHILIDCADLTFIRQRFYNVNNLKELFDKVNIDTILNFLKEVNLFTKKI